jgi:hypothetical protein
MIGADDRSGGSGGDHLSDLPMILVADDNRETADSLVRDLSRRWGRLRGPRVLTW